MEWFNTYKHPIFKGLIVVTAVPFISVLLGSLFEGGLNSLIFSLLFSLVSAYSLLTLYDTFIMRTREKALRRIAENEINIQLIKTDVWELQENIHKEDAPNVRANNAKEVLEAIKDR